MMEVKQEGCIINQSKMILQRISQFVLDDTSFALREEVYKNLIMYVLSDAKQELTFKEIYKKIEEDLSLESLPVKPVRTSLALMIERKNVIMVETDGVEKYFLSKDLMKKMSILHENFVKNRKQAYETLIEFAKVIWKKRISRKERRRIVREFDRFLGQIFSKLGVECARSIIGQKGSVSEVILSSLEGSTNFLEDETNIFQEMEEKPISFTQRVIIECIREKNKELAPFLFAIAQSYYLIQILHMDPECQQFCENTLSGKTLYLDTNCLLYLFIDDPEKSESVRELVTTSRDLGINVCYTERTKLEYMNLIATWKHQYSAYQPIPFDRFNKIKEKIKIKLLADFNGKRKINPNLNWEGYFARLELFDTLIQPYATIDNESIAEIYESPQFESLIEIINAVTPQKSSNVQEHDAYHILYVERRRKEKRQDILGPNCWFLTFDTSLDDVERSFIGKKDSIQSSILVEKLTEMIAPFLAPKSPGRDRAATFSKLFASSLPRFGSLIEELDVVLAHGPWMDIEGLEAEDIAFIMGNTRTRKILKEIRKELEVPAPPDLLVKLNEELQKIANELIKETKLTVKPLEEKVKRLELDVETLTQEKQTILKLDQYKTTQIQSLEERNILLFRVLLGLLICIPLILTSIFFLWLLTDPNSIIAIWGTFGGIIMVIVGACFQFKEVRNFVRRLLRSSNLE